MTTKSKKSAHSLVYGILAMTAVVVASNYLVQFPVHAQLGPINLADLWTWGAFTYPIAFLVTDLINRQYGPAAARKVVYFGFATAIIISVLLATPRIAIASGSAFLFAQLLDVHVFNRLRRLSWWKAPVASSTLGTILDTLMFFGIAFSTSFAFLGSHDAFAVESAKLFGYFSVEVPRWISWALGDFSFKFLVATGLLVPYRVILGMLGAMPTPHHS